MTTPTSFHWTNFIFTSQESAFVGPLSKLFKDFHTVYNFGCFDLRKWEKCPNFEILILQNLLIWFKDNFVEMLLEWPTTKIVQAVLTWYKVLVRFQDNLAEMFHYWPFSFHNLFGYGYSENFLLLKCLTDFQIVEMFLKWPTIRFLQAMLIIKKTMAAMQGAGGLYGYSKKLKIGWAIQGHNGPLV